MNATQSRDAIGVGLCLDTRGAVIAVVRQNPLRVAAVATVTWPVALWRPDPPSRDAMSAGRRVLAQARQRLRLPRWCPVVVVAGPSLSTGGTPDWVSSRGAELLARATLAQGWAITPEWAAKLLAGTHLAVPAELAAAMDGAEANLAVGAAIAAVAPAADPGKGRDPAPSKGSGPDPSKGSNPDPGWAGPPLSRPSPPTQPSPPIQPSQPSPPIQPSPPSRPDRPYEPQPQPQPFVAAGPDWESGWAVQRIGDTITAPPLDSGPRYGGSTATRQR
ncbi:MAG TPA: hypothetical protein VF062_24705 [Candidatus Limnocylindrales bacterium]